MVVLQEQGRGLGVVLAGSDVQGRQANLALSIVLQQQGDHLVMALLESHRQRGEAVLKGRGRHRGTVSEELWSLNPEGGGGCVAGWMGDGLMSPIHLVTPAGWKQVGERRRCQGYFILLHGQIKLNKSCRIF